MGSLIHIAEIAVLIFAAYVVGWLVGYVLHRIVARPAGTSVAMAESPTSSRDAAMPPEDALVRAPAVAAVAATPPPHVQAKVTQIEPATAVAVPDGMVFAEPKSIDVPNPAPAPVSAMDSLKSLSTAAIPLVPIELRPIAPAEPAIPAPAPIEPEAPEVASIVEPAAVEPVTAEPVTAAPVADEPVTAVGPSTPATEPVPTPIVEPEAVEATPAVAAEEPFPAPVIEIPTEAPAPDAVPETEASKPMAMPSSRPGVAWSGAIKGREASPFARVGDADTAAPAAAAETQSPAGLDVALLDNLAAELETDEPGLPVDQLDQMAAAAESNATPAVDVADNAEAAAPVTEVSNEAVEPISAIYEPSPAISEPTAATPELPPAVAEAPSQEVGAPETSTVPEEPAAPVVAAPQPPRQFDEDAAMKAIEGGWSRRQTRAMSDARELTDVSAAVSAAQVAVEQVLAANGIDAGEQGTRAQASFGKPRGLPHPRNNRRDNLKQINGLGPLDESTLNNMGIYHFEQVATWDQKEVLWLENHAFARGRIGREDWQAQAKALMVDSEAARRIGG